MTARKKAAVSCRKAEPNSNNGRVTVAVLGTKLDALAEDVKGLRLDHNQHVSDGTRVFERLSAMEGKWMVLMWGAPIALTIVGVVASILFALR